MLWIQRLWIKLQTLFRSERAGQSLNDELQFHLEQQIAENVAAGMSKEEARYAAMRLFGNHTMVAENARETWGWIWLEQAGQDLRYAFRSLRKSPLFTAVAILTLALGIGATTSIFTLFYDVLLKSLTVANPGELYRSSLAVISFRNPSALPRILALSLSVFPTSPFPAQRVLPTLSRSPSVTSENHSW